MKRYYDTYTSRAHVFAMPMRRNGRSSVKDNTWANRVYAILRKQQPKWAGFSFMPKGEVK